MKKIKTLALLFLISFMTGGCENYHESIFELWNNGRETIVIKELSVDDNVFVRNVELAPVNVTETGGKDDNRQNVQIRLWVRKL